ncbi:hypothetical protein M0804_004249 [Polistes exclamans]|nr:hypothetical protein M0804_004249 [Polistes exclamans]
MQQRTMLLPAATVTTTTTITTTTNTITITTTVTAASATAITTTTTTTSVLWQTRQKCRHFTYASPFDTSQRQYPEEDEANDKKIVARIDDTLTSET